MTVSVLLPTRNRLEYLRLAIETVLRQDNPNWELVVSDNASAEDIAGYVSALGDKRIRYVRSEDFVSVTENWNNALAHSTGDWVVMLGDDDGLLPGFVRRIHELAERTVTPDLIYTNALLLTYPGATPEDPAGSLKPYGYAEFLRGHHAPFELERTTALRMVRAAMRFRVRYGFNMQFSTLSRRLVERLAPDGVLFRGPFPDYYATNVAFLEAERILVEPKPMVVIGVTPKSYGFFHARQQEAQGQAFLAGDTEDSSDYLPGSNIYRGWLGAVEEIEERYGHKWGLRVSRKRFRRLQALWVYEHHFIRGSLPRQELDELERRLSEPERLLYRAAVTIALAGARILPPRLRRAVDYGFHRALNTHPGWNPDRIAGHYTNVIDVYAEYDKVGVLGT